MSYYADRGSDHIFDEILPTVAKLDSVARVAFFTFVFDQMVSETSFQVNASFAKGSILRDWTDFQMRAVQKFEKNIKVRLKYCCLAGAQILSVKYDAPIFDEKMAFMFSEGCKTAWVFLRKTLFLSRLFSWHCSKEDDTNSS